MERKTKGGGALSTGARADVKEKDRNGEADFFAGADVFFPNWARDSLLTINASDLHCMTDDPPMPPMPPMRIHPNTMSIEFSSDSGLAIAVIRVIGASLVCHG